MKWPKVNGHLHTPYSFSAFDSLEHALEMAATENVKIVGINDFYTTAGYLEWHTGCAKRNLYPLYNIEFISLQQEDQAKGILVNDPNNPGRTYLSGKGQASPPVLPEPFASQLAGVLSETDSQIKAMCDKLNEVLEKIDAGFKLDIEQVRRELTKGNIRERHLAKALRIAIYSHVKDDGARILLFEKLFSGKALKSELQDFAGVENEIRGNLLKAGGPAFVAEDPKAFLPMADVQAIIMAGGGIPTYPFLADDPEGHYTAFEEDLVKAAATLKKRGFSSCEFISTRNDVTLLENYVTYLWEEGFVITLGTEHNTPVMEPVEPFARNNTPLTDRLQQINYQSACVVAAHQEMYAREKRHYNPKCRQEYIDAGDKLIQSIIR